MNLIPKHRLFSACFNSLPAPDSCCCQLLPSSLISSEMFWIIMLHPLSFYSGCGSEETGHCSSWRRRLMHFLSPSPETFLCCTIANGELSISGMLQPVTVLGFSPEAVPCPSVQLQHSTCCLPLQLPGPHCLPCAQLAGRRVEELP